MNLILVFHYVLHVIKMQITIALCLLLFILSIIYFRSEQEGEIFEYTISPNNKPPENPPDDLLNDYTINNTITLERYYVNDVSFDGSKTHFMFPIELINDFTKSAEKIKKRILTAQANTDLPLESLTGFFPKDYWIYLATLKHVSNNNDKKLTAIIFGTQSPWLEAWLIYIGIDQVVTSEYNDLTFDHPQMKTISGGMNSLKDFNNTFDLAFSISSFDHDGLGRYGDPLNPNGDIEAMKLVKYVLKSTGQLYLTIPIGPDVIVWNLHRRYGNIRLPMLLVGWTILDRIGWKDELLDMDADFRRTYEPVFILSPNSENLNIKSNFNDEL